MNNNWWQTVVENLFKVKSLVTILLTTAFVVMALKGGVEPKDFYSIIVMVLTFYFGYQSAKSEDKNKPTHDDQE
jgi:hypothetical protein|nr:MAG TPA: hypothetical protein [Caudoviricetes sp.]DAR23351.1 MAG TPA: hypothetical protein [Caudoviricetes sp.]